LDKVRILGSPLANNLAGDTGSQSKSIEKWAKVIRAANLKAQ
jgi:hypothetical protein